MTSAQGLAYPGFRIRLSGAINSGWAEQQPRKSLLLSPAMSTSPRVSDAHHTISSPVLLSRVTLPSPPISGPKARASPPSVSSTQERPVASQRTHKLTSKRTHLQFTTQSDQLGSLEPDYLMPHKKIKRIFTTVGTMFTLELDTHFEQMQTSAPQKTEGEENLHYHRMLHLARTSRNTLAARLEYHRERVRELQTMCCMAVDDCKQAEALLMKAEWQIGEIKHILDHEGIGLLEHGDLFAHAGCRQATVGDNNQDDVCMLNESRSTTPSYFYDSN